jgi:hypothetical protein
VLLRMIPEAVSATWDEISAQLERAIPDGEKTEQTMSNLLEMLLLGQADCWTSYDAEDDNKVNFIGVTVPVYNGITGEKNLLLYNVTNSDSGMDLKTSNRLWLEGFQAFGKYMRANGFKKLVSYFDNERSLKLSKRLGAEIKYYVEFDMTKEG